MAVNPIPEGYHSVTPYLIVGSANELIEFLKKAFEGRETSRSARDDGSIAHAEVKIGDSMVMIADGNEEWEPSTTMINLYVEDCDSTYKRALEAGGESLREPEDQFYGDRMAGVKDPAGNKWWIGTHIEDVSEEEMAARVKEAGSEH